MTSRTASLLKSWLWALVPLLSLGIGSGAIMAHAAAKKRSWIQALTVPVYVGALVAMFAVDPDHGGTEDLIFGIGLGVNLGVGFVHAVAIRGWVFSEGLRGSDTLHDRQRQALAAVREQEQARNAARELVASQPEAARQLLVGRPDLPNREYPDGGLIDVNQVTAPVLAGYLSLRPEVAEHIVGIRDRVGGYSSYDDMLLLTNTDHRETDQVSGLMVFGRRG